MYREFEFNCPQSSGCPEALIDTDKDEVYIGNLNTGVWLTMEEAEYLFGNVLCVIIDGNY